MTDAISQDQLASLRARLQERRQGLRTELQQEKAAPERAQSDSQDIESSYASDLEHQVGEGLHEQHLAELRSIELALQRIDAGNYGVCQDCGGQIDLKRLSAYPAARRCIECKEVFEKHSGLLR